MRKGDRGEGWRISGRGLGYERDGARRRGASIGSGLSKWGYGEMGCSLPLDQGIEEWK